MTEKRLTEEQFQQQVTDLCDHLHLLWYHTHDSRRSNGGFPDLVIVSPQTGIIVFAELKTDKGKVTPAQYDWLNALGIAHEEVYLWRPADLPEVIKVLHGVAGRRIPA